MSGVEAYLLKTSDADRTTRVSTGCTPEKPLYPEFLLGRVVKERFLFLFSPFPFQAYSLHDEPKLPGGGRKRLIISSLLIRDVTRAFRFQTEKQIHKNIHIF